MKDSEYYYGLEYDKQLVRQHLEPHYRKIEWTKKLIKKLLDEPIETRDFVRINRCIKAILFNETIIAEALED